MDNTTTLQKSVSCKGSRIQSPSQSWWALLRGPALFASAKIQSMFIFILWGNCMSGFDASMALSTMKVSIYFDLVFVWMCGFGFTRVISKLINANFW